MTRLTIALDMMGGDNGPLITLPGAIKALQKDPHLGLILCGNQSQISSLLGSQAETFADRLQILHCSETVLADEKPTAALRNKKDSSMRRMLELVKQGKAAACVSAGNTGALMAKAYYVLKTLPGIDRPALISALPTPSNHKVFLLDLGANVNCDAEILFQYGVMGAVLAEQVANIDCPRVALLNVGEESIKGNERVKYADRLLSSSEHINYIGYVEGDDIFTDVADVVVTDGFTGNIALKSTEGLVKLLIREVKRVSSENLLARIIASFAFPILRKVYQRVNPDQYNGASLIGLRGIVVKSHGNASADAFCYAIQEAVREARMGVPDKIKNKLEMVLMERL